MVGDLRWRGITPSLVDPTGQIERGPRMKYSRRSFQLELAIVYRAKESLQAAGIELKPMDLDRIGKGIDRLAESGGQKGLLIGEKTALVVDVTRRTVTHASARQEARDHVFSEVDSVMLLD